MGDSTPAPTPKPAKPYPTFPLYAHASGRWAKKIKGKLYYFGKWDDADAALKNYLDRRAGIQIGRDRPKKGSVSPTLQELANLYLHHCKQRLVAGDLAQRTLDDYTKTLKRLATIRGKDDEPGEWTSDDFAQIKEALASPVVRTNGPRGIVKGLKGRAVKRRASTTVDIDLRSIKAFLHWCSECEHIPEPKFGPSFKQTSLKAKRIRKAEIGPRDLTPAEIRTYLEHATDTYKGILLLGINAGMGASDISALSVDDYSGEWLDRHRQKTGVLRRIWLWPETRTAIDAHIAKRWRLKDEQPLFVTTHLNPWVRDGFDAIGGMFGKIRDEHGLRGSFYDLRRTFETIAEETLDFPAVKHVMGHAASGSDMSAVYRQRVTDDRIRKVCEHVRTWLFSKDGGAE